MALFTSKKTYAFRCWVNDDRVNFGFKEWNDYSDSKVVSKSELVRLLTLKCLEGPAKIVCHEVTSVAEAMERLKTSYGNVRHLFDKKAKEIAKLGQCKGNASSKRDWICEM